MLCTTELVFIKLVILLQYFRALSCCVPGSGPEHVKIIAEWDPQTKARYGLSNSGSESESESALPRYCLCNNYV